jgi:hypothetical protein
MAHISGHDCSQLLLLPEAMDDYVGADNPVRLIDAFVDVEKRVQTMIPLL